jgi:4-coumarate--CoA ligase
MYIMQRFNSEEFCESIQRNMITVTFVVPPVVLLLAKHPLVDTYNLSSLRLVNSSAAPLSDHLVDMVYKRLKVPIKQSYGMSEASPAIATQVRLPLLVRDLRH